ncbi:TIGR03759 family integrating conjugative element protein [Mergibacter septicus]|uniref:TIGR03759 family integrating conjugative element protein n=1 Tax=Mergibacter septicus TaxID=221402 RepID=UPI0021C2D215|nr:TIGR03759 family integrating conjugative element protein [Mergibacter septicus]UTU48593.1 TIGR03759 family integrating conjugative element protein [Mergibacter septicus]
MKYYKFFSFLCLVVVSKIAMSAGNIEQYSTVNITNAQNADDSQAIEWGLSKEEWQRYEKLRNGERKFWSPNLDPLTILGIEAKNDIERKKYAQLLAKKEFERVEKELAFQRAYDEAFKELYGNILIIKSDKERITFFTRTKKLSNL